MEDELKEKIYSEAQALEGALSASEKQIETHGEKGKIDPFSVFGKVAAVVVIIALLLGGGIYLGKNLNKNSNTQTPTPTVNPSVTQTEKVGPSAAPTAGSAATLDKSTTAGPANGTSFKVYQVDYPSSWTLAKEKTDVTDKLTLTKGAYSISIYQAPSEGGQCVYPGESGGAFSTDYKHFTDIQGAQTKLRLSWNDEGPTISYTVCSSSDGKTYGYPTPFGYTTVKATNPADPATMSEIEAILASLTTK